MSTPTTSQTPESTELSDASSSSITENTSSRTSMSSSTTLNQTTSVSTTSAQSSETSTTLPTPPPTDKVLNGGQAAGVAIGGIIFGAAVALLLFSWLYRRKRTQWPRSARANRRVKDHKPEGYDDEPAQVPRAHRTLTVEEFLPQSVEDRKITSELSILCSNIKAHAQEYYVTDAGALHIDERNYLEFVGATGISTTKLRDILQDPSTRVAGIRLFIAWAILHRCGLNAVSLNDTLLPSQVSEMAPFLTLEDNASSGKYLCPESDTPVDNGHLASVFLISRWKAISATLLLRQPRSGATPMVSNENFKATVKVLDTVLSQYAIRSEVSNDKRLRNLSTIVEKGCTIALLLFSQKSFFKISWTSRRHHGLVVFPELQRVVDDEGARLTPPGELSRADYA